MDLFKNKSINILNLQLGFVRLADILFSSFGPIFLIKQGLSVPTVLAFYALFSVLRILLRYLQIPLVKKIGVRNAAIVGALGIGISYLFLPFADSVNVWLWLYITVGAFFSSMYWMSYHYLFWILGNNDNRGKNVSAQIVFVQGLHVLGPVLSAILIVKGGFLNYTMAIFCFFVTAGIFLLFLPNSHSIKEIASFREAVKNCNTYIMRLSIVQSTAEQSYKFIWSIVLFLTLGEIISYGWAITLGMLANMISQFFIGPRLDLGKGSSLNTTGLFLQLASLFGRVFLGFKFAPVVFFESLQRFGDGVTEPATSVAYYNTVKDPSRAYWELFFAETGWDIGAIIGLLGIAGLIVSGVPIRLSMIAAVIPTVILWKIVDSYYQKNRIQI